MITTRWVLLLAFSLFGACHDTEPTPDAGPQADAGSTADAGVSTDASLPPTPQRAFTHKMMKRTGENMFAMLGYECNTCTFEQHLAIVAPEGWTKGPTQVSAFTRGTLRSRPAFDGVPDAIDFVDEVPGDEYLLIVKTLSGELIERRPERIVARTQVQRDTLLTFAAGARVHELTDPDGGVFVLFAYSVDPVDTVLPDFNDPDLLADLVPPEGWSYASRVLTEDLNLDTPDTATVLAIRGGTDSTWQMR